MTRGEISVAENGLLMFAGATAWGAPLTFRPETSGDYQGGAVLHGMRNELGERVFGTAFPAGQSRSVSTRVIPGQADPVIVYAGSINAPENPQDENFLAHHPIQPQRGGGTQDGFFMVFNGRGGQTSGAPSDSPAFPPAPGPIPREEVSKHKWSAGMEMRFWFTGQSTDRLSAFPSTFYPPRIKPTWMNIFPAEMITREAFFPSRIGDPQSHLKIGAQQVRISHD